MGKHGWQVEKPLKVFENGDVFLKRNICGKLHYIGLFDKKYRMKKQQPYDTIDETKFGSYIIRNFEDLYGLVDENLNEILEIKHQKIFKLEDSNYIEVREKNDERGQIFCTRTNKFIDTEGNLVSDWQTYFFEGPAETQRGFPYSQKINSISFSFYSEITQNFSLTILNPLPQGTIFWTSSIHLASKGGL